ncbi:MAG: UDP-N-acetylmuramate dehydrogenase [Pseudomonadota bacterium]
MMASAISYSGNGVLRSQEPLNKHTSWRVGGEAEWYFKPTNLEELREFLSELARDIPVTWLGLGSNVLIRDGGIKGVVVATHGALDELDLLDDTTVYAQAGVPCAKIARQCAKWGLADAHFFAGIPGTLGGALAMNAGAFGGETWKHVKKARLLSRTGELSEHEASEFQVSYRHVELPVPSWFVGAWLKFDQKTVDKGQIRSLLLKRKRSQPIGLPSCGSVFRNPPGDFAARLIQAADLKGFRIGGAQVSEKHANFIINEDNATAADIEALIDHVQTVVDERFNVRLQREVRIIGEQQS